MQTLIVASAASAAASFAVSRIRGPGTLISAAATPVIVAFVSEFLRRPLQAVSATTKRAPRTRMSPAPVTGMPVAEPEPIAYATSGPWRPHWKLAVTTGLVAFAIVVGVYTVPDIVAGHSITGSGHSTTFFGGSASTTKKPHAAKSKPVATTTPKASAKATTTGKPRAKPAPSTSVVIPTTTPTTTPPAGAAPTVAEPTVTPATPAP